MRRTLPSMLLAVVLATIVAATPASGEPELGGTYMAAGVNPDGSEYRGIVQIVRRGESFIVRWIFPRGSGEVFVLEPASIGIGIRSGAVFAVSYFTAQAAGVVIYHIEEEGKRLTGQWTGVGDDGAVYGETLTRLPARAAEPGETDPAPAPKEAPTRRTPAWSGRASTL